MNFNAALFVENGASVSEVAADLPICLEMVRQAKIRTREKQ